MDMVFAVLVFHVARSLVRNEEGELVYEGGSIEKFDKMDLDLVNLEDLVKRLEDELGYKTKKKLHWLDIADDHLEFEFHIYVEHEVSVPHPTENPTAPEVEPIVLDDEGSSSTSTDDGGYESAEDEYISPPTTGPKVGPRPKPMAAMGGPNVNEEDGPANQGIPGQSVKNGVIFYQSEVPSSEEEYVYEYESETLHTPISSDEEFTKHRWPEFNNMYGFLGCGEGSVHC
ncbi:hypothetical protein PIB30_022232 [Stylosanthes scabra]|uniref:PB1-like domain-containing protein n=1 Tax=Stylosanthes scabra TaxID=79078 RepID=A0ABU6Q9K8_9FABA|nr:hypothetical protein [Stylosanthes scabra]